MNITGFNHNLGETSCTDGTGNATLNVGAVLNVGAKQAAGVYTGTFDCNRSLRIINSSTTIYFLGRSFHMGWSVPGKIKKRT